jgi:peptidase E
MKASYALCQICTNNDGRAGLTVADVLWAVEHFTSLGVQVEALPVIDSASANDPALAAAVDKANFVYLSGGKPDYLYRTLDGSLVWRAILSMLERGGLLAGCSAGPLPAWAGHF